MPENLPLSSRVEREDMAETSRAGREVVLPRGVESLRLPTRKRPGLMKAQGAQLPWLGRRDSNPQQPAPKTGVLPLNYVPMCGVAQKQLV